ncbi:MAG: hypothetical protein M5R36_13415 [Deltaproteobacteria bacterium]|nr:hypothetical protein [Deltaproteobacteria bacterium]
METITALVKNAIGFTEKRGDRLEVANIQFNPAFDVPEAAAPGRDIQFIRMIVNYVLYGLLLVAVVVMGFRLVRFLTNEPAYQEAGQLAGLLPAGVANLEQQLLAEGEGGGVRLIGREAPEEELPENGPLPTARLRRLESERRKLVENATKDQKAVTLMIRKWLREEN